MDHSISEGGNISQERKKREKKRWTRKIDESIALHFNIYTLYIDLSELKKNEVVHWKIEELQKKFESIYLCNMKLRRLNAMRNIARLSEGCMPLLPQRFRCIVNRTVSYAVSNDDPSQIEQRKQSKSTGDGSSNDSTLGIRGSEDD